MNTIIDFATSANRRRRWLNRTVSFFLIAMAAFIIINARDSGHTSLNAAVPPSTTSVSNLDWPYYGNDLANRRYQNVDLINPSNVGSLTPAWVFHTGVLDPEASLEVSPIMVNGTLYVTSGHDDVFALDAATGQEKWAYHPLTQDDMVPFDQLTICCGRANRGVAVGNGKVFIGRLDDILVALDANTGAILWKATVVDFHDDFSIDGSAVR